MVQKKSKEGEPGLVHTKGTSLDIRSTVMLRLTVKQIPSLISGINFLFSDIQTLLTVHHKSI